MKGGREPTLGYKIWGNQDNAVFRFVQIFSVNSFEVKLFPDRGMFNHPGICFYFLDSVFFIQ